MVVDLYKQIQVNRKMATKDSDLSDKSLQRHLLPQDVRPKHYKLVLEPELPSSASTVQGSKENLYFQGSADIELEVISPTSSITLHAVDLDLNKITLRLDSNRSIQVTQVTFDKAQETATIHFTESLPVGKDVCLNLWFKGILNDKLIGFYRSTYKTQSGETRYMAASHFEPNDARRAFPCWDEPAIKAKFDITLVAPAELDCLSNMSVVSERVNDNGKKEVHFEETPLMSTYLLVFIVGEFDFIEGRTPEGVRMRVYTSKGSSYLGRFALQVGIDSLSFFTRFFDIEYPLPKMALVAIPDFATGAMENWGCITFREITLLIDPEKSSTHARSLVAEVVAHELAHQWFGNLVTMEWWTHLWLNEGFATWAADLAVDHLFPDWKIWMGFVSSTLAAAMKLDSLESSHPIEVEIKKASDVNEIFDAISYNKGASVIRMLANYLSLPVFQRGLQVYLKSLCYKNATTDDLWNILEQVSGKPVFSMMSLWTRQVGYPLIQLEKRTAGEFLLKQTRFLSNGKQDKENSSYWIVPIGYILSTSPHEVKYHVLQSKSEEIKQLCTEREHWVKMNAFQTGVYRMNYPLSIWKAFEDPIRTGLLKGTDRLGLSMDSFALCRAGVLPTTVALEIMSYFEHEKEFTCWEDLLSNFATLFTVFGSKDDHCRLLLEQYFCHLLQPIASELGFFPRENEEHCTRLLRPKILRAMVDYQDKSTIKTARDLFTQSIPSESISADLRSVVMAAGISQGGREEFEKVKQIYEKSSLIEEKMNCITVLGLSPDPLLIEEMLEWSWQNVRPGDFMYCLYSLSLNRNNGSERAWYYVKEHYHDLLQRYGTGGGHMLRNIIYLSTRYLTSIEYAHEMEAFFKDKDVQGCERVIQQSLEAVAIADAWYHRDEQHVCTWLENHLSQLENHSCHS